MYNTELATQKRNKILIIILLVFGFFIIGLAVWQQVSRIGKVQVEVKYAPYSARVEIDGKKVKNNHQIYLATGEHEVTVTQEGFDDLTQKVNVDESTGYIYGLMTPNSDQGQEIYSKRQNEFLEVQGLYGMAAVQSGEEQRAKWPIMNHLPINNAVFSLGYTIKEGDKFLIIIEAPDTYLESAVNTLKSLPQDKSLAEYDITIKNFQNPFAKSFISNNSSSPLDFLRQGYQNINCTVNEGIKDNNYYYTTITAGDPKQFNVVTYRVLIEYISNQWRLTTTPYPLLTTYNTPDVPVQILNAINKL